MVLGVSMERCPLRCVLLVILMWGYPITHTSAAVVTVGFFDQCISDISECTTQNLPQGQYANCNDCSQFAKCNGQTSAFLDCPAGLNYDAAIGVCNYVDQVTCRTTSPTSPTTRPANAVTAGGDSGDTVTIAVFNACVSTTEECVTTNRPAGQYAHCDYCRKFFKCNGATSVLVDCPAGLHYDVRLGVCDFIGRAYCFK